MNQQRNYEKQTIDWPAFMGQHDMMFNALPSGWQGAPHFGNAMVGSMLYQVGNTLRLQVFRADVHDHRDDSYGWTAYSRPHFRIGHFSLDPVGTLTGCSWRKDLWNAELTGTVTTDRGEIGIRHFVHADDMAIVTELTPSTGENKCRWSWHPAKAWTSRPGYPTNAEELEAFADRYGGYYTEMLKPYAPNPEGRKEEDGDVSVWIQDLMAGGQYATAWDERDEEGTRILVVSIDNSYPDADAAVTSVADVRRFLELDRSSWVEAHRAWWHAYYPKSFVSLPDKGMESLYWQTIYRLGCTSRTGRFFTDTPGIWFQGGPWAYITTDWNIQSAHWGVYAANRLEQGEELVNRLHERREDLVRAVRPVEWQEDSAYLAIAVAWDMIGSRDGDMRYFDCVGNLTWTMNNMWSQYRYSMDKRMLRDKIFPLLRRSINLYLHMIETGSDRKLHLPPTYSPETGVFADANFDLALLKWGCHTLLKTCTLLGIDDPLVPRWKEVVTNLPDFSFDERGFRIGSNQTSKDEHRHFSNLLLIYPLYLVNIEQEGTADVLAGSYDRAHNTGGLHAMVQTHAGPIGTAIGQGDQALEGLKRLQSDLHPNGTWSCGGNPCLESSLAVANNVQEMLIQSWTDPAADKSGPIRVFPALPSAWQDVEFHDLRTEGAFLVSAQRRGGETQWVRIKSLAGEPCRVRPGFRGSATVAGNAGCAIRQVSPGIYEIDLKKDEEVVLRPVRGQ
jgi:alpha-L-fucosidase 2